MSNAGDNREAKGYSSPLPYFILFVIAISLLLSFLFDFWSGSYGEVKRNPHFRRAWSEHVMSASPKEPGEMLVIIISNSQGYGREVDDDRTYAFQLEKILQKRLQSPVRVLNWSIPGGRAPEFPVLGAAAGRLNPDLLLMIGEPRTYGFFYTDLDEDGRFKKSWASDSLSLLAYPDVLSHMPGEYISEYVRPIDRVDIAISRFWRAWRYRDLPVAWLMRFKMFRRFENKPKAETWFYNSSWIRKQPKTGRTMSTRTDRGMIDLYLRSIEDIKARKVYIEMPVMAYLSDSYPGFFEYAASRFESAGGEAWDFSSKLPNKYFIIGMHMNEKGNRLFAELIAERLLP